MGWEIRDISSGVTVRLDSHGGEREREHERLAEELDASLKAALLAVLRDPKYREILLFDPDWYT